MSRPVRGGLARVWTDYGTVGTVQQLTRAQLSLTRGQMGAKRLHKGLDINSVLLFMLI